MKRTTIFTPTSRCRLGISRIDITPPVGIYHRFWGAAKHDRATGVHRPLTATVLVTQTPGETSSKENLHLLIAVDHCLLRPVEMDELLNQTADRLGLDSTQITFTFSHTHSGGHLARGRAELPGGDLIGPYLDALPAKIAQSAQLAIDSRQDVVLTYAVASSQMGHNRDCRDDENELYVCGFNPDHETQLPVHVVRISTGAGKLLGTIVNYPCHPTTLAWDNTLISPDYIGALRETVERDTDAPCLFLLAPCGDIGPRYGFVGDVDVADSNGRELAYAALSALESMPPAQTDYHYTGPVISGATIGAWEHQPQGESHRDTGSLFRHRAWSVPSPYREGLPTLEETRQKLETCLEQEAVALEAGNEQQARDQRALAERSRRTLEKIQPLPEGSAYPFAISLWQMGDAFWVAVEGEPYHLLQEELLRRFPENPIIVITLANGSRCSYLPRKDDYEKDLYQVSIAVLAPGSLETITDEISQQIEVWLKDSSV